MTLLEQARSYVQKDGFSVFPLVPGDKRPFKAWSWKVLQTRKPTDSELESWFTKSVNLAIVTGTVSGNLLVLDFDNMAVFSDWYEMTRLETRTVKTGKGVHLYFRCVEGFNGDMYVNGRLAGQARCDGGYVVAPPSVHPSGVVYRWTNDAPVLAVDLGTLRVTPTRERLGTDAGKRPSVNSTPRKIDPARIRDGVKYAQTGLDRECEHVRNAEEHSRNNTLYKSALKCRKHVDTIGAAAVCDALVSAAMSAGLPESEARRTIQNAWNVARY